MGAPLSRIMGSDKSDTVRGVGERLKNIAYKNFRGILGTLLPLCLLPWQTEYMRHHLTVQVAFILLTLYYFLQPIAVPCTGMIPIFLFPMTGVMSTHDVAKCYFNENICLFLLSSMLLLVLNNSGFDRRICVWLLCSGDGCQFSAKRLVFKSSVAAFTLSMFSNRLIVTSTLTQYVTPTLMNMQASYGKNKRYPDYDEIRHIINNCIQTSSAIGSIAIMHSAYASLAFRALWCEILPSGLEFPDIFNFMQWSCYALPLAFCMWVCNVVYHMFLINCYSRRPMNAANMNEVKNSLLQLRRNIPKKVTSHEKLAVFFTIAYLLLFFCRWSELMGKTKNGWADYRQPSSTTTEAAPPPEGRVKRATVTITDQAPVIKDAVVAGMFVVVLHSLPRSYDFLKVLQADKPSELEGMKPESGILWWRFVDQNTNYGYMFVIGSGITLLKNALHYGLGQYFKTHLEVLDWQGLLFVVSLVSIFLANIMTGVAALVILLPFVITACMTISEKPDIPLPLNFYLPALGVAIGSSLGFISPFMYTPAYFCHHVGKVPKMRMLRYSWFPLVFCLVLLWLSLYLWAPYCWDPENKGFRPVVSPVLSVKPVPTTTEAPTPAPPPPEI